MHRQIRIIAAALAAVLLLGAAPAYAIRDERGKAEPARSDPVPRATDAEKQVFEYLTADAGFSVAGACGAMANINAGSGFDPEALSSDGEYGLMQLNGAEYDGMAEYCDRKGLDHRTIEGQMKYLLHMTNTAYQELAEQYGAYPETAEDAYLAGYAWSTAFERDDWDKETADRAGESAQNYYWPIFKSSVPIVEGRKNGMYLGPMTTTEEERTVYDYLTRTMGYTVAGAVGVMANIRAESNFDPWALGDGGTSIGLCQWHNSRYGTLKKFSDEIGLSYTSMDAQLRYLEWDAGRYADLTELLRTAPNTLEAAKECARQWSLQYERPGGGEESAEKRALYVELRYWPVFGANAEIDRPADAETDTPPSDSIVGAELTPEPNADIASESAVISPMAEDNSWPDSF